MKFLIGNFVNWYEEYDDGISGKDSGDGIITDKRDHTSYGYKNYFTYKVYRTKHKDFYWFEERQLTSKDTK